MQHNVSLILEEEPMDESVHKYTILLPEYANPLALWSTAG